MSGDVDSNIVDVVELDDAEKVVRMTEWDNNEVWEYSENEESSKDNNLAAAKRFLAAQSFLLSWQQGKVPTGWRRPRRIGDFEGKFPSKVVDAAEEMAAERIAKRTQEKTARLNASILARGKSVSNDTPEQEKASLDKKQLDALKSDLSSFNHQFFEVKSSLSKATTAIADISFRVQALSEVLK